MQTDQPPPGWRHQASHRTPALWPLVLGGLGACPPRPAGQCGLLGLLGAPVKKNKKRKKHTASRPPSWPVVCGAFLVSVVRTALPFDASVEAHSQNCQLTTRNGTL